MEEKSWHGLPDEKYIGAEFSVSPIGGSLAASMSKVSC